MPSPMSFDAGEGVPAGTWNTWSSRRACPRHHKLARSAARRGIAIQRGLHVRVCSTDAQSAETDGLPSTTDAAATNAACPRETGG
jgi:hypothetical protein